MSSSSSPFLTCAIHARPKHGSSAGWGGLSQGLMPKTSGNNLSLLNKTHLENRSPFLTCAIYVVWNCLETGPILVVFFCFRKGDAPSMWHILVRLVYGCREIWGSCAIYVGIPSLILANEWELRRLCPKKAAWCWGKIIGAKPAQKIAKNKSVLGTYMAQLTFFEWELRHASPAFCLWHRWRNSRNWATYFWGE